MAKSYRLLLSIPLFAGLSSGQSNVLKKVETVRQSFEPNRGQADRGVDFTSHGPGYTLSLAAGSADLQLVSPAAAELSASLRLRLVGSESGARAEGVDRLMGKSNYLLGSDSRRWLTDIPQYGRVEYHGVYPGIDLAYYGNNQRLEYDFIVGAHADPRRIRLAVEGADRIQIDPAGDLVLTVGSAEIRERKPVIYQESPNGRSAVDGRYVALGGNLIGFEMGIYDRNRPLVIDPILVFSTFFGKADNDLGQGVALDSSGNIYLCGGVGAGAFGGTVIGTPSFVSPDSAAFVTKISPAGALISSTYIGGANGSAMATAIALDGNGNIYLTGNTTTTSFPIVNGVQRNAGGAGDAFALELNSAGSALIYSTYLGGSAVDAAFGIAVDQNGNTLVTGWTQSANFPVLNAMQPALAGSADVFAVKIAPGGASFVYSTYFGGSGADYNSGVAVDSGGDLIVYGNTNSPNFPVVNAFVPGLCGYVQGQGVNPHGFAAALSPLGTPIYSTFLCGSSATDSVRGAVVDAAGNTIFTGATASLTFPTLNPVQASYGGGASDAFVTKLSPTGTLLYSSYLGGNGADVGRGVALDPLGNFYVTGYTTSTNYPTTANATQKLRSGADDVFLTKTNSTGSAIVFSTYLGGTGEDYAFSVAVDSLANAYVGGKTASSNFPTASAMQATYGGGSYDAFLTSFSTCDFSFSSVPVIAAAGGAGSTSITTTAECGWAATSNSPWITITSSPANGAGSGSVAFSVAANSGATRVGSLTIGGRTVSATQSGTPVLSVTEIHSGNFTQGQNGAIYTVTVSNAPVGGPTAGAVTLTQSLPAGLTLVSMSGTGWTCAGAVCTRSDALATGAGYPAVTVTVNVAANAGTPLAAQVNVSGGGSASAATATDNTTIAAAAAPALSVTETNAAGFTQGQSGAAYTVVVGNGAAAGSTAGTVTLTQTLPTGLTLVSMSGTGWSCGGAVCTRSDVLGAGASYPAVTVTVNVAANAGSPLTAQVSVSGGGSATVSGSDVTNIAPAATPSLSLSETNSASFTQGQTGAIYTVVIGNGAGAGATSGTVTLTQTLPTGLTLVSMSGTGWSCGGAVCTRSDVLAAGASYPTVTVTVNVAANAGSPLTAQVSASGGGSAATATASDVTTIVASAAVPALTVMETNAASFTQGQNGAVYTVTVSNGAAAGPTSGTVTISQTLPAGLSLVSMAGNGWSCGGSVCTRNDVLGGGASYPAVTVTVNVGANAASPLTSQITVSGGGSATATASDVTTIRQASVSLTLTSQGPIDFNLQGMTLMGLSGTQTNNCPNLFVVNATCTFTLTFSGGANQTLMVPDWALYSKYAAADQQLIQGPADPTRLVFIGDSITVNWDQPSPYGANSLSNVRPFVNRGISGQTLEHFLVRFREDVIKLHPAAVHIFGGTNDLGVNAGPETNDQILDQIVSMTEIAKANGIKVLIASITPVLDTAGNVWSVRRPAATIIALNQMIRDYCQQSGAVYVDYYSVLADANGNMIANKTVDGLHPNTSGYAAMVPIAQQALQLALGY